MKKGVVVLIVGGGQTPSAKSGESSDLIPILGRPSAGYVLETAASLAPDEVVFLHPDGEKEAAETLRKWRECLRKDHPLRPLKFKSPPRSPERRMREALKTAAPVLKRNRNKDILLIASDHILLRSRTLKAMLAAHRKQGCSLTLQVSVGSAGEQEALLFRSGDMIPLLPALARSPKGTLQEILTKQLILRKKRVGLYALPHPDEAHPGRGPAGLARATSVLRARKTEALGRSGVRLLDPQTAWIDWDVKIGTGTVIYPSVFVEGFSRIGRNCRIYPHVHILNSRIRDGVNVLDCTVMEDCVLEKEAQAGPFSRLRPGTRLRAGARVGNFVEMKNTVFGARSKANHLSYLGDSLVEEGVNIGAGTITCNYDGVRKSRTHIGTGVFIGSGTELIAPVRVGRGAYVAAGSTITKDVAPNSLAIARARQQGKPGWVLDKIRERRKGRKS